METRVSIEEAGSNALVAAVGFYTKLLDRARQTEAGLRRALTSEHQRWAEASIELSIARDKLAKRPPFADEKAFLDWYLSLAEHLRFLAHVTPVLEAVTELCEGIESDADRRSVLSPELAHLQRRYMAARANGGLVPPPAPPHPDALRAAANGSPERDA